MVVVVFRAELKNVDAAYGETAERMRALAFAEFGCIAFHACNEGDRELAVSYWPDEEHVRRWRAHKEHREAQRLARERWYTSYSVDVAHVTRGHTWP